MPWHKERGGGRMASEMRRACQGRLGPSSSSTPLRLCSRDGRLWPHHLQSSDKWRVVLSQRPSIVTPCQMTLLRPHPKSLQIRAWFILELCWLILIDVKVSLSWQPVPMEVLETVPTIYWQGRKLDHILKSLLCVFGQSRTHHYISQFSLRNWSIYLNWKHQQILEDNK